jgi:hypothetical protein
MGVTVGEGWFSGAGGQIGVLAMRQAICAVILLVTAGSSRALAWGCDAHQAVAILAERLLDASTVMTMRAVLAASPIDPAIRPFCPSVAGDPIADAATWADDDRAIHPSTAGWHFIDFPLVLGANVGDYKKFCPNGNCVVDAIVTQYRILKTIADPRVKGNALRYLIHFIGDLHQPLHTTTNGDRGGNCLPITYYDQVPREDGFHNFRPNLHGVWDDGTIRRLMVTRGLADSRALADFVAGNGALRAVKAEAPTTALVASWARGANAIARTITYGKLPASVPLEPAETFSLARCDDNNHAGHRMAALAERIDATYEQASVPVIMSELRLAAERLAAVLKAAFP